MCSTGFGHAECFKQGYVDAEEVLLDFRRKGRCARDAVEATAEAECLADAFEDQVAREPVTPCHIVIISIILEANFANMCT